MLNSAAPMKVPTDNPTAPRAVPRGTTRGQAANGPADQAGSAAEQRAATAAAHQAGSAAEQRPVNGAAHQAAAAGTASETVSETDVVVIGGGPAGSSAAIVLAERGHRVAQLEKSRHPRFHIGESLLPANLPLFERLGVAGEVRAIGMRKWGAEFVSPWHGGRGETFNFTGDDDLWVFINGQLAMDIGGVHGTSPGTLNVDTLGLTKGSQYPIDIFNAERHTSQSDMRIDTTLSFTNCGTVIPN